MALQAQPRPMLTKSLPATFRRATSCRNSRCRRRPLILSSVIPKEVLPASVSNQEQTRFTAPPTTGWNRVVWQRMTSGNSRGQGRPFTYSNRPGFSVGGPVWIPKVYNGKDKTFFMFGYEQIKDSRPRFDAGNSVYVPTP